MSSNNSNPKEDFSVSQDPWEYDSETSKGDNPEVQNVPETTLPTNEILKIEILKQRPTMSQTAQELYQNVGIIPESIKINLDLIASEFVTRINQLDLELQNDPKFQLNGHFVGYDNPEVKKTIYSAFGLSIRDEKHMVEGDKLWKKTKNILSRDIFQHSDKAYIGKEVLGILQRHANMNHLAGIVGSVASLEIGEGLLNQLNSFGILDSSNPFFAFVVNSIGFKMIVDKNDDFLEDEDLSIKAGKLERIKSLSIIWGMRTLLLGATAFAGFIHLEKLDLQLYSDRLAQTILEDMGMKASVDENNIKLLVSLNKLKVKTTPLVSDINEVKAIESELLKNPPSTEVLKIAQDSSLTQEQRISLENRSNALFHQVGAMSKQGNAKREQETIAERKLIVERLNGANITPPSTTVYNDAKKERLTTPSGTFAKKYSKYVINVEKQKVYDEMIAENDPHKLSLSTKFQVAVDRLKYENSHNKTLSLAINSLGAMFFESFSIFTMIAVLRNKKFKNIYSNKEFQSKYASLITQLTALVNEHAQKVDSMYDANEKSGKAKLIYQGIIDDLLKDLGKIGDHKLVNTSQLVDWYLKNLEEKAKDDSVMSLFGGTVDKTMKRPWKATIEKNENKRNGGK